MGATAGGWWRWDWVEITDVGGSKRGSSREEGESRRGIRDEKEGIVGYARVRAAVYLYTPPFL